jgi:putative membrane protein
MTFGAQFKIVSVACLLLGGRALAADAPPTADVLGKLHRSNLKEIEMGKMAESHGQSKDVKKFGKMLADDHTAADKKVSQLAKEEKIDLTSNTPAAETAEKMPMGAEFDAAFAKSMLEDHNKDVNEAKTVQGATSDPKLKSLLNDIVPVLEKHQRTAQKLVDKVGKS